MKFVLQWHITHKCNLRCTHCYQEEYSKDLPMEDLKKMFHQLVAFLNFHHYTGHINFTGGEPFLSPHLFSLFDLCEENNIRFGILTNGTFLTQPLISKLKQYKKLSFIQISIDGTKTTHDKIRGTGNFDKSFAALRLLRKNHIQTMVSFTCHKENYKELKEVIRIVRKNKIDRFWCDRLIPIGSNQENILDTAEYRDVIKLLTAESRKKFSKTKIHTNRALQFCEGGSEIYQCSAGTKLLTLLADGTLLPCRRLPLELGNVTKQDMLTLYQNSDIIHDLKKNKIPDECNSCLKANLCRGGAKCLSYALHNDYNRKDVNCYF